MIFNLNNYYFIDKNCYISIYAEIYLIIAILILIVFLVNLDYYFEYVHIFSHTISKVTVFISLISLFLLSNNNFANFSIFYNLFVLDYFLITIKCVILIATIFCILISFNYLKIEKIFHYEYFLLILLAISGILIIISSNDLITFYLAIELQSLSFYVLAAFKMFSNFSTEASLKYFILGAFSSGILLFGCSLIYGFTGLTNFGDLNLLFLTSPKPYIFWGISVGILFVSIGILFKLGAAPFHMWLPDVYEGVPTVVTMIFSIIPKIGLISFFMYIGMKFFVTSVYFWQQLLLYVAIISLLVGTFGALYQLKLKRLLAYSAIGHVGFLLINVAVLNIDSIFAAIFYLLVYMIISVNLFSIILVLRKRTNNLKLKKISEIILLIKSNPLLAFMFCFILFSIAGIPPLVGFYSKFYVFVVTIQNNLYIIGILAAIISVIASLYYIRVIKLMFFKTFEYWNFFYDVNKIEGLIISSTFLFNILFFLYPTLFTVSLYNLIFSIVL